MRLARKSVLSLAAAGVTGLAIVIGSAGAASGATSARAGAREVAPAILGPHTASLQVSQNWSGYALGVKTTPKGTYKSISATWKIPTVGKNTGSKYAAQWIGIDGQWNQDLIQTGTETDYYGGKAHYGVWWEILPNPETMINEPVKPGETMTASIVDNSGTWTIKISNGSWTFTKKTKYKGPGESAECIVEATDVGGTIASITRTSNVTFSDMVVNGANPKLTTAEGIYLKQKGIVREMPSDPSKSGNAFTMAYGKKAPPAPTS